MLKFVALLLLLLLGSVACQHDVRTVSIASPTKGQIIAAGEDVPIEIKVVDESGASPSISAAGRHQCTVTIESTTRKIKAGERTMFPALEESGEYEISATCAHITATSTFVIKEFDMDLRANPTRCIVFGDGIVSGVLAKHAHIYVQPVNIHGQNITTAHHGNHFAASITSDVAGLTLTQEANGILHIQYVWRVAETAVVSISVNHQTLHASPWQVEVGERYGLDVGREPWGHKTSSSNSNDNDDDNIMSVRRHAYATLVTTPSFVAGAVVVAHTLRTTGTEKPFVALVPPTLDQTNRDILSSAGWIVKEVAPLPNPNAQHKHHFRDVYTKLRLWEMVEYDKVVFLDSDTMVLQPIDHLFDVKFDKDATLYAATEINPPALFNAGVLVLQPNLTVMHDMMVKAPLIPAYDKTDQGFLNEYFMGKWAMLPYTCNLLKDRSALQERFQWFITEKLDEIFVVHLTGEKPWLCLDDYHCNVAGRVAPELWNMWWKFMDQACESGVVACTRR